MEACAINIVRDAKVLAARNIGILARGISYVKISEFDFKIISAANYSAFMEFGTKRSVVIPAGFEEEAAKFKGVKIDSGGQTLLQAIEIWAKQKGIPDKDVLFIYLKILFQGVKPHPFIIPAYLANIKKLEKRLTRILAA